MVGILYVALVPPLATFVQPLLPSSDDCHW